MNIKRAFLVLAAVLLLPSLAMAGTTNSGPGFFDFQVDIEFDPPNFVDKTDVFIECDFVEAPNDRTEDDVGHLGQAEFNFEADDVALSSCVVTASEVDGWNSSYLGFGLGTEGQPNPNSKDCTFNAPRFTDS